MNVLVACEYSGAVRDAFKARGHYAVSCDLLPTDAEGLHYQGDVFDLIDRDPQFWDLMVAHPPCTYLCNSGVSWLYDRKTGARNEARWDSMREGAQFFKRLLESGIPKIAVENPIIHKHAKSIIGVDQTQLIQPWMFGHPESKATCLWLKGLPPLVPTNDVKAIMKTLPKKQAQRLHMLPPSAERWKLRSATFKGIAEAMAEQWG